MVHTIISTTGLSIIQGRTGLKRYEVSLTPGHEEQQLRALVRRLTEDEIAGLSAELSTLKELKAGRHDRLVFLATDTDDGERAARFNAVIAKEWLHIFEASHPRLSSLVLLSLE